MADASIIVKIVDQTRGGIGSVVGQVDRLEGSTNRASTGFNGLNRAIGAVAAALSVRAFIDFGTQVQNIQNRINLINPTLGEATTHFRNIAQIANDTYQPLNAVADLYQKVARNAAEYGLNAQQITTVTQTFTDILRLAGADANTASSAILQFGQALGVGALKGDEFTSIVEATAGEILPVLAHQLGVSSGQLKQLAADGEITGQVLIDALSNAADSVAEKTSAMSVTIGGALTVLQNKFLELGTNATPVFDAVAQAILFVADNLDLVVLAAGTFFTMFAVTKIAAITSEFANLALGAGKFLAAMAPTIIAGVSTAIATLRTGIIALNATMLTNPIALAIAAISAAVLLAITHWDDFSSAVSNAFNSAENIILQVYKTFLEFIETAINGAAQAIFNMGVRFTSVLRGIAAALTNPTNAMQAFKDEIERGRQTIENTDVTVVDFSGKIQDLERRLEENRQTTEDATDATEDLGDAKDSTGNAVDDLTDATDDETVAVDDNTTAVMDNEDAQIDLESQLARTESQVQRVEDAFIDYSRELERSVYLSGLSADARELETEQMRGLEAMARSLGKTVEELSATERANVESYVAGQIEKRRANEAYQDELRDFDRETQRQIRENYEATTSEVQRLTDELQEYQATARRLGLEDHKDTQDAILNYEREINEARQQETEDLLEAQQRALDEHRSEFSSVYRDIENFLEDTLGIKKESWNRYNEWFKFLTGTELLGSYDSFLGNLLMGTQQTTNGIVNTMQGGLIPAIPNIFTNIGTFIGNIFGVNGGGGILGTIGSFVTQALGLFGEGGLFGGIRNIFSNIGGFFSNLFSGGGGIFSGIVNGIENFLGDVVGGITGLFGGGAGGAIGSVGGLPPGVNVNDLLNPPTPTAASMISSGMPFNVAHGVPEIVGYQMQHLDVLQELIDATHANNNAMHLYAEAIDAYQIAQEQAMADGILTDSERADLETIARHGSVLFDQGQDAAQREAEIQRRHDELMDRIDYLIVGSAGRAIDVNLQVQAIDSRNLLDNMLTIREELTHVLRDAFARSGRSL